MIDVMVYRAEGWTVRTGGDLYAMRATYAELPTTYPPFAALLFIPLTLLDVADMRTLATAGNLVLLVAVVHLSLRLIGRPSRVSKPASVLLIASLAVWCEPVWTTLRYGQINLLLTALVLWDLSRRSGHRWAGVGIGIAAGIKLTPALFVVFLALCGAVQCVRRRAAATAAVPASGGTRPCAKPPSPQGRSWARCSGCDRAAVRLAPFLADRRFSSRTASATRRSPTTRR